MGYIEKRKKMKAEMKGDQAAEVTS